MRCRMLELVLPPLGVLALAGCGKAPDAERQGSASYDLAPAEPQAMVPPAIGPTAAPGVAFAYRYAFRLPPAAIAGVQESHAQTCERLGPARCRITGMRYRLLGENKVEAMLQFKLDPAIARVFGRTGIAAATAARGKLVDAEITGTDAGGAIDRLDAQRGDAEATRRRLSAELAKPGRSAAERTQLQGERAEVERQLAATRADTADQRESLARTPMTFQYESGTAIRGFDSSAPFASALDTAIGSAQATLAVVLGIIAIFGPPALVLLAAWLLWRRFRPAVRRRPESVRATEADPG